MFIGCMPNNGYPDYYWIDNINSLHELQSYVQNNMPVIGREVNERYKRSIVLKKDLSSKIIYLNNYLNIFEAGLYFMDEDEHDKLENEKCLTCKLYDSVWGCRSKYIPDNVNICANYSEPKTKMKRNWLKFWRS